MKLLSLCIATNGMSNWVLPVLDRIYKTSIDPKLWEVVVTNNGDNAEFEMKMSEYVERFDNLKYSKNNAYMFENQIEALRLAEGEYLKFLNHRSLLNDGALEWMMSVVSENIEDKPIIYWSNGVLRKRKQMKYDDFDSFVCGLREYASWTTGVGVWKSDFDTIPIDWQYNKISPHSDVLYWVRDNRKYIIDDRAWSRDIDESHENKGQYDLYRAFAVEEIMIPLQLYIDGYISDKTLKRVKKAYMRCVAKFYARFNLLKEPCSYDISGFSSNTDVIISKWKTMVMVWFYVPLVLLLYIKNNRR